MVIVTMHTLYILLIMISKTMMSNLNIYPKQVLVKVQINT